MLESKLVLRVNVVGCRLRLCFVNVVKSLGLLTIQTTLSHSLIHSILKGKKIHFFVQDGPRALKIWTVFYNLEKVVAPPHLKGRAAERCKQNG